MSNSQKNFMTIRSKLLAAVAMLLVASFMVVSSTYAWFTLSTAPEVTGITTQIGANGNLEIALSSGPATTPTNGVGVSDPAQKNLNWGNILNLGLDAYGLNKVILKPSSLVLSGASAGDTDAKVDISLPLRTPVYGSDGRIEELKANGLFGKYDTTKGGFVKSTDGYGVRAIGTVSSMTAQQLQFTTAMSQLKSSLEAISRYAANSLENEYEKIMGPDPDGLVAGDIEKPLSNGGKLVSILLKGGLDNAATYVVYDDPATPANENELGALKAMLDQLNKIPDELESAVKNYMMLLVAKGTQDKADAEFALIKQTFDANWDSIFTQLKDVSTTTITIDMAEGEDVSITLEGTIAELVKASAAAHTAITTKLAAANETYGEAETAKSASWDDVKDILSSIMDISDVTIGGKKLDEIMADPNKKSWALALATSLVPVAMPYDSGVYSDVASVTKNIKVDFRADVNVRYGEEDLKVPNMKISMFTELTTEQIKPLTTLTPEAPADKTTSDADAVISDTYAYVLDFVFRTNAADSNLLLQQDATDRIYSDNQDTTSETWGGGSYMEFTPSEGFHTTDVAKLMKNIRIVFVNTADGQILAAAGLDADKATTSEGAVRAKVKLCSYSVNASLALEFGNFLADDAQVITALGQNEATHISAYVYLDGETVTNADVAALSSTSATGVLNLQFASSSKLVPMDYSDLKNKNQNAEQTTEATTAATTAEETTAAGN